MINTHIYLLYTHLLLYEAVTYTTHNVILHNVGNILIETNMILLLKLEKKKFQLIKIVQWKYPVERNFSSHVVTKCLTSAQIA